MIAVLGRRNQIIYLPAELIAFNDLHPSVKQKLPTIASYVPDDRNKCIEKIRGFLIPGAQKTKGSSGLLPALGIVFKDERLSAKVEVLAMPALFAAGVPLPKNNTENWAPALKDAKFNVSPNQVVNLNVVLVCHKDIDYNPVYGTVRNLVNRFSARYRLGDKPLVVDAGECAKEPAGFFVLASAH
jgi:hypothetical protein